MRFYWIFLGIMLLGTLVFAAETKCPKLPSEEIIQKINTLELVKGLLVFGAGAVFMLALLSGGFYLKGPDSQLKKWASIGAVVGVVLFILLLIVLFFYQNITGPLVLGVPPQPQ